MFTKVSSIINIIVNILTYLNKNLKMSALNYKESTLPQCGSHITTLKDFKVVERLGEGSYSSVYRVVRLSDNQVYALKRGY